MAKLTYEVRDLDEDEDEGIREVDLDKATFFGVYSRTSEPPPAMNPSLWVADFASRSDAVFFALKKEAMQ